MTRLLATALLLLPLGGASLAQGRDAEVSATTTFKFEPETINVAVGGTVTWTNDSDVFHTVTGGEDSPDPSSPVGNGTIAARGATYKVTFRKAGTYPYFCQPHLAQRMVGTVVVGNAAASPSPRVVSPAVTAPATPTASPAESVPEGENPTLAKIDAQRAAQETTLGGFRAFTWAATAALIALGVALVASTRARRGGR